MLNTLFTMKVIMLKVLLSGLIGLLSQVSEADVQTLSQQMQRQYPNLNLQQIQTTPVANIYSALLDGQVVYLDDSGQYLFSGNLLRLKDQKNLTQEQTWTNLPFQDAIQIVKGSGQHQLAVFSDPNCPYCKNLERELAQLDDVTIYLFIYPLKPESRQLAKQLWCSPNRSYAWQRLMLQGILPTATTECEQPIERNLKLGQRLGFDGTPSLIFSNGIKNIGVLSKNQIQQFWQQHGL